MSNYFCENPDCDAHLEMRRGCEFAVIHVGLNDKITRRIFAKDGRVILRVCNKCAKAWEYIQWACTKKEREVTE
jgi:hypothetical protein